MKISQHQVSIRITFVTTTLVESVCWDGHIRIPQGKSGLYGPCPRQALVAFVAAINCFLNLKSISKLACWGTSYLARKCSAINAWLTLTMMRGPEELSKNLPETISREVVCCKS